MKRRPRRIVEEVTRWAHVDYQLKALADVPEGKAGVFEGMASTFWGVDSVGDMILPGAFTADLPAYKAHPLLCFMHNLARPIGLADDVHEEPDGLFLRGVVSDTVDGRDVMTLIRDQVIKKLSIGYRLRSGWYQFADRKSLPDILKSLGYNDDVIAKALQAYDVSDFDGIYLLKRILLREVSPVSLAANNDAAITTAKGSLADLTLAEQAAAVMEQVEDYARRLEAVKSLRAADGRTISADQLGQARQLVEHFEAITADLKAISGALPADEPEAVDGYAVFMEAQKTLARLAGVNV